MPVKKHRLGGLKGTEHGSRGLIGTGIEETFLPTGDLCDGYGDLTGAAGGYGEEEAGYGDPCSVEGWFVLAVLEESLSASEVSEIKLGSTSLGNLVREDGGELVVVATADDIEDGPYRVSIRPTAGGKTREAYSGVLEQGTKILPDLVNKRFSFVAPFAAQVGEADLIIDKPSGQVVVSAAFEYVPYSQRSQTRLMRNLYPNNLYDTGHYEPTVS